jgi:hypothetical protein
VEGSRQRATEHILGTETSESSVVEEQHVRTEYRQTDETERWVKMLDLAGNFDYLFLLG